MNEIVVAIFHAELCYKVKQIRTITEKKIKKKKATCFTFQDSLTIIIAKFASF